MREPKPSSSSLPFPFLCNVAVFYKKLNSYLFCFENRGSLDPDGWVLDFGSEEFERPKWEAEARGVGIARVR